MSRKLTVTEHRCWNCGGQAYGAVSAAGSEDGARPGDVVLCGDCLEPGALVTFAGRWSTVKPSEEQLRVLSINPQYREVLEAARVRRQALSNLRAQA